MSRQFFFPQILRKINIAVISIFNELQVAKLNSDGTVINYRQVPIVFGHKGKFLSSISKVSKSDFNKFLPMMSIIITAISKNSTKSRGGHLQPLMKYFNGTSESIQKIIGHVPYTISYSLSIISKSLSEMENILEQILPQFTPYETITIQEFSFLPEFTRDIKVNLVSIEPNFIDEVEEGEIKRIECELAFDVDCWFYRPILASSIIKNVKAEFYDSSLVPETSAVHLTTYSYVVSGSDPSNFNVLEDTWISEIP